jgi:hypothetical protein
MVLLYWIPPGPLLFIHPREGREYDEQAGNFLTGQFSLKYFEFFISFQINMCKSNMRPEDHVPLQVFKYFTRPSPNSHTVKGPSRLNPYQGCKRIGYERIVILSYPHLLYFFGYRFGYESDIRRISEYESDIIQIQI